MIRRPHYYVSASSIIKGRQNINISKINWSSKQGSPLPIHNNLVGIPPIPSQILPSNLSLHLFSKPPRPLKPSSLPHPRPFLPVLPILSLNNLDFPASFGPTVRPPRCLEKLEKQVQYNERDDRARHGGHGDEEGSRAAVAAEGGGAEFPAFLPGHGTDVFVVDGGEEITVFGKGDAC